MPSATVLVPSGSIGTGPRSREAWDRGVAAGPDVIAVDGGSTDSGPHYLGSGTAKCSVGSLRAELKVLMEARARLGIPLIVGSCGTCGSDAGVDLMRGICEDIARELGQVVRVACIYSQQSADAVKAALAQGRILALQPERPIDAALVDRCTHIVAAMGAEPIIHALEKGAEIVLAGRATDTALMAAVPLMKKVHAGAAWHAGKILECGAMCTTKPSSGVVMATIDDSGFTVRALADGARATPRTVHAHMLYENSNPFVLVEPGGVLDVASSTYTVIDEQQVRVEGSTWTPSATYTVKLEGAAPAGWQAVSLCIVRSPRYLARFDEWLEGLESRVRTAISVQLGLAPADYHLQFRSIGQDAALGGMETRRGDPTEIGVMAVVTSPAASRTKEIIGLMSPPMLHFGLPDDEETATHCFPLSPASMDRGLAYEFVLNHVMAVDDPLSPFRFEYHTFGSAA
jgi:hypothetical protein